MGCSRQSQNIFYYTKIKNWKMVWYLLKNFNRTTFEDTIMPYMCLVFGHKPYQPDKEYEPNNWACKRCHTYIKYNERKEKLKKLRNK